MAIASNFPAIRPSLNLDFANARTLDPRITFGRASAATYYDGKTVAKAEENLLLNSAILATQSVATRAEPYTLSFIGTGTVTLSGTSTAGPLVGTGAATRVSLTFTPTAGTLTLTVTGAVEQAQLEARSVATAYTPTTTQPITNYIPVLQTAQAGVPRFDHNPVTGESLGMTVEEQRTNLMLRSEQFSNAYWTKTKASISDDVLVAPDGTITADKLIEDTQNGLHRLERRVAVTNAVHTFSCFFKKAERSSVLIQIFDEEVGSTKVLAIFDLDLGVIASSTTGTAYIDSLGNGWYRCSVVTSAALNAGTSLVWISLRNSASSTYTGDGSSGVYIWGVQFGAGSFPASYIKTEASQVTRAADSVQVSSLGQVGAGTIYVDATVRSGNTLATSGATTFAATASTRQKTAVAYDAASTRKSINGAAVTSAAGTQGGSNISIAPGATGWINKLSIYPQKFGDAHLQSLTA